ncbi:acyltransferase domain-containing protein [Actimicrobium antarcticum]|uniref:Malonate decarboxylase subunit epsilon n=1 Tax=Actimicrobium antarcticum TaxID=1051899 RepID=A0ABP7SX05_9BURK
MSRRYAILCPGQGGQHPAMFVMSDGATDLPLPADLAQILHDPVRLFSNRLAQPLVVAAGLSRWEAIRSLIPAPDLIAGYSVGELTAYGVAGALPSASLVALAAERAMLMDACVDPHAPHRMLAISGLMRHSLAPMLLAHHLFVAIDNGADRLVVGGLASRSGDIESTVMVLGGTCQRLPVAVASHTPLMLGAATGFAAALAAQPWRTASVPVLSGIGAAKVTDVAMAQTTLVAQLSQTILWQDCLDACVENGIGVTLELGPGDALSRMMRARHPQVESRSIDSFRSIDGAASWLKRQIA